MRIVERIKKEKNIFWRRCWEIKGSDIKREGNRKRNIDKAREIEREIERGEVEKKRDDRKIW